MAKILVIEDEQNLRLAIRKALTKSGHEVAEAGCLREARAHLQRVEFDLVITDVMLGSETGMELVRELRGTQAAGGTGGTGGTGGMGGVGGAFDGVIVVMTAFGTVESAVAAMREGADDYLQKPLSLEELSIQTKRWLDQRAAVKRLKLYERLERTREQENDALGASAAWAGTLAMADRLASIPLAAPTAEAGGGLPCILLMGETGVGKGVLARHIHARACEHAARSAGNSGGGRPPFVHVNCGALPATLVEAELFGHEKGAFTDAREARPGLFEMADGGTIFLDEIAEMPLELQARLLLVVEQGIFRRVGGSRERTVRVRVIAASNQDLDGRVAAGAFRRDLLYRLNAFTIRIPALRDREDDARLIAESLLARFTRRYGRGAMAFSPAAMEAIRRHSWPGNVRELVNSVQRAVMLCDSGTIEPLDLGLPPTAIAPAATPGVPAVVVTVGGGGGGGDAPRANGTAPAPAAPGSGDLVFNFESGIHTADEVERTLIIQALQKTGGNVSRAAKLIGMQRSSLRYRIERYHLESHTKEIAKR